MHYKNKLLVLLAGLCLALGLTSANAHSQNDGEFFQGLYVAGTSQLDFRQRDKFPALHVGYNPGWGATGALGVHFLDYFRSELEVGFRRSDIESARMIGSGPGFGPVTQNVTGHTRQWTLMNNYFWDIPVYENFGVSLGAGAGISYFKHEFRGKSGHDTAFAYQLIPGLYYNLSDNWTLTTDYRFISTSPIHNSRAQDTSNWSCTHAVTVGLRYSF